MENHGGVVIVSNCGTIIIVDGTDCPLPVKINAFIVSKNEIGVHGVLRIDSIWRVHAPLNSNAADASTVENSS